MDPKHLRMIFGKLTDMSFDIARLDTLVRQKHGLKGLTLDLTDRATAGIEATIEEDFTRLATLLGFEVGKRLEPNACLSPQLSRNKPSASIT